MCQTEYMLFRLHGCTRNLDSIGVYKALEQLTQALHIVCEMSPIAMAFEDTHTSSGFELIENGYIYVLVDAANGDVRVHIYQPLTVEPAVLLRLLGKHFECKTSDVRTTGMAEIV